MDGWTFVSNITAALAWPAVVAAIAFGFREEIKRLFHLTQDLKKFKLGPVEAEMFEREAKEAMALAAVLPESREIVPASPPAPNPEALSEHSSFDMPAETDSAPSGASSIASAAHERVGEAGNSEAEVDGWEVLRSISVSPRHAVLAAWKPVEALLRTMAVKYKLRPSLSFSVLLTKLRTLGAINSDEFLLLRRLYELSHQARSATTDTISSEAAIDFVVAVRVLRSKLDGPHFRERVSRDPVTGEFVRSDRGAPVG